MMSCYRGYIPTKPLFHPYVYEFSAPASKAPAGPDATAGAGAGAASEWPQRFFLGGRFGWLVVSNIFFMFTSIWRNDPV